MKRRAIVTGITALSLLLPGAAWAGTQDATGSAATTNGGIPGPTVIAFNQAPKFNNYLTCFDGWVYVDFVDPDGDDTKMKVQMAVYRSATGSTYHPMKNSGQTTHGVFFSAKLSDHGINPAQVTGYAFRATDQAGIKSKWTYADANCKVL